MLPLILNPTPLLFTIATTFGVLVHDTQIDRAASAALMVPAALVSFAAIDQVIKSGDQHMHIERISIPNQLGSLSSNSPRTQPRDDDRRYQQTKKLYFGARNNDYSWPSI